MTNEFPNTEELDDFLKAYIVCALWSSNDDDDIPLDRNWCEEDIDEDTLEQMRQDCKKFMIENREDIEKYPDRGTHSGLAQSGHDFWLDRHHHGCGSWNRDYLPEGVGDRLTKNAQKFGEFNLFAYDGKIGT